MRHIFFLLFFVLAFATQAAKPVQAAKPAKTYAPLYNPFNKTAYLTSSFGESRGTRYHAGIDLSTEMEEGWAVLAPSNGFVEYAERSPFGYGRYIKFRAQDNHIWLFAHLSNYAEQIENTIKFKMIASENPIVKWSNFKLPFKKGDTIAFSGSTGIGNPHLHIELRSPNGKTALNPCKKMQCADTIAPYILDIAPFDTGFAVKIVDYSRTPLENPMSVYSLNISANKKIIFSKKYDSLKFSEMAKIKNDLINADDTAHPDTVSDWHFIPIKSKPYFGKKIKALARDFAGNLTTAEFVLRQNYLLPKKKDSLVVFLDTIPPQISRVYTKTSYAGEECRFVVSDSLSGLDFASVDFRDKKNNWVIFDYDSDPEELVIERRDFNFAEPLILKMCDKAKNCITKEHYCASQP